MPRTTVVVVIVCAVATAIALVAVLAVTLRSDSSQAGTTISVSDGNATSVEMVSGKNRNSPNIFSPSPAIPSTAPSSLAAASISELPSDIPTVGSSEQTSRLSLISPVARFTTSTGPSEEASFFSSLSETADASGGGTSSGSWLSSFSSSTYGASAMPWTVDPSELPSPTPSEYSRINASSRTPSLDPTALEMLTGRPTVTPSSSPEKAPLSPTPTQLPSAPPTTSKPLTVMPSVSPSVSPSETPLSRSPSKLPTAKPTTSQPLTVMPSVSPSSPPSQTPLSPSPSELPSAQPTTSKPLTVVPSASPSFRPSETLSRPPSKLPTAQPAISMPLTAMPSVPPSFSPSETPLSRSPSKLPTAQPTTSMPLTVMPSISPSFSPSETPLSRSPSKPPTAQPTTSMPSVTPSSSRRPSQSPSAQPTTSISPTLMPSVTPSSSPSETLSRTPSQKPSVKPTSSMPLTVMPSVSPSFSPSETLPSHTPTEFPSIEDDGFTKNVDSFQVLETISHDTDAFTQGMTFSPNDLTTLYESTGLYGSSDVRKVDITSGEVIQLVETGSQYFGEGLAYFPDGKLIHITWKERTGFIFDAETLEVLEEFQFTTTRNEGWGITYNPADDVFIVSDGSQYLHFWNRNLQQISRVAVTYQTSTMTSPQAITNLNELEWDDSTGTILANVWQTDLILRIDPQTGFVKTRNDLSNLYPNRSPSANVLNGIAIHPITGDLWITGKLWPLMYRLQDLQ